MKIYYYDISAFFVLALILFSIINRKMYRGRTNRIFLFYVTLAMICTITDCLSDAPSSFLWTFRSHIVVREICSFLYFLCRAFHAPMYFVFIASLMGVWSHYIKSNINRVFFGVPLLVDVILVLLNPFFHWIYTFANGEYQRTFLIPVLYVIGLYYIVYTILFLYRYRKMLPKEHYICLMLLFPINLSVMTIQFFLPQFLLEMFGMTLSLFLITITIMRPEDYRDSYAGTKSYDGYWKDIRQGFISNYGVRTVLLKIKNSEGLINLVGNEKYRIVIRDIIKEHKKITSTMRPEYYYLGSGLIALNYPERVEKEPLILDTRLIQNKLMKGLYLGSMELNIDSVACVATIPEDFKDIEEFRNFVDSMERCIAGNQLVDFSEAVLQEEFRLKSQMDHIIAEAITNDRFEMYYQPIYNVKQNRFTSAEALIRLDTGEDGFLSPGMFIPAAEQSGAILQIGDFVIRDVCRYVKEHDLMELGLEYIEINLSAIQCMQTAMVDQVKKHFDQEEVPVNQINFEITETVTDSMNDIMKKNMWRLYNLGVEFSLDDYGTGVSNLQRIVTFPFKIIKLDKSFLERMNDEKIRLVLEDTIRMIKNIGAQIVVEGVETAEAAKWFAERGCDYIQGFYYARPMDEQSFTTFMREHRKG